MNKTEFEARYEEYRAATEQILTGCFAAPVAWQKLYDSMHYSLCAGGKRIRPILVLEFCRMNGGDWKKALPAAAAVEMVHTYSLIHDDLPCMDDDDLRRGKPTNHKIFGEMMATLAGDGLQAAAFSEIVEAEDFSAEQRIQMSACLARACGPAGMVAGQVLDIMPHESENELCRLHALKTGAMISAACKIGCIAAGASDDFICAAQEYADGIGLAFQVWDDLLDVTGDEEQMGKPVGSDREEGKFTFVDLMGIDGARTYAQQCTEKAKAAISGVPDSAFLTMLADRLIARKS